MRSKHHRDRQTIATRIVVVLVTTGLAVSGCADGTLADSAGADSGGPDAVGEGPAGADTGSQPRRDTLPSADTASDRTDTCQGETCGGASCSNAVRDGQESDVDCGGPDCSACPVGDQCKDDGDCQSERCEAGTCKEKPTCSDGTHNGQETDTDCGGPDCEACGNGKACVFDSDCQSVDCNQGTCRAEPTCTDGMKNGSETDVDCGGPDCGACGDGAQCGGPSDCKTDLECAGGTCKPPSDQPPGASCSSDGQCLSNICSGGQCAHLLFVTSKEYAGGFGMSTASTKCQSLYGSGDWKAILSASVHAKNYISVTAPIYNTKGEKIADSASDLWDGSLDAAPAYDEDGGYQVGAVWTGTSWQGESTRQGNDGVCVDWASSNSDYKGTIGYASATDRDWVESESWLCSNENHLYCFMMP